MAHVESLPHHAEHGGEQPRTDPLSALLFGVLASVVVALALTEQFQAVAPATIACVAAWVVARLEVRTRE